MIETSICMFLNVYNVKIDLVFLLVIWLLD